MRQTKCAKISMYTGSEGNKGVNYKVRFTKCLKMFMMAGQWWHMPLIPVLKKAVADAFKARPAWFTERVPGKPGLLYRETLSQNTKQKRKRRKKNNIHDKIGGKH